MKCSTKLNQTGTAAVWSVCLPVTATAVKPDATGSIYVAGSVIVDPAGINSVVSTIVKLSPDAKQTLYSTSIDGTSATKLALDRAGNVYVAGGAQPRFKATPGAYLTTGGNSFAAKLNASGVVEYATFLDFVSFERVDIAADSMGQAWVVGASCPDYAGTNCNRFGTASAIRRLDAKGAALLVKKTFGGGVGPFSILFNDLALGVAVDATDSAWIVGTAESAQVPTTPGALGFKPPQGLQTAPGLGYALKLSPSGDVLYGTYVGLNMGGGDLAIHSVTVDDQGRPYFALNQPDSPNIRSVATVMALSADGSTVLASAKLNSAVREIALDGKGGLYTAGTTNTVAFLASPGAYQPVYPGGPSAGYTARFDLTMPSPAQFSVVVNAATLVRGYNLFVAEGAVAPGEIITLFGKGLPPNPNVTFDGRRAPILYADANQINAVVPFEVSASSTMVAVEGVGGYVVPVFPAVPGLFTAAGGGSGQLAALNEDGSINSSNNRARAGSVVSVYMTGLGAMTPPLANGQLGPLQPPFPIPVLGVSARVNNVDAPVLFAGQAPGLIAGVVQVNVRIPAGTASGDAGLVVYVGNYQSQIGRTTIAVQ